jgi:GT2 family glycosyltransferase
MNVGRNAITEQPGAQPPEISIVVLTWNGRQYLEACLSALQLQEAVSAETILVDNASTDGTAAFVRERFPAVRIVELERNVGFAAGNNAGARQARGRYLAFLNNDTVPHPGWLRALRAGVDDDSGFVLITSRIVYMHDPTVLDSAGDGFLRWGGAFKRHHGAPIELAMEPAEVFGVCGAACLVRRDVFEELGGFDEDFFASHEDVDLSYRARLLGYRCRYVADAIVKHHGSATLGRVSALAVFFGQRNLEWVYLKNTPGTLLLRTLPGHLAYNVAAAAYFARQRRLGAFLRAKGAALAGLPGAIRKRRIVQRSRRVDAAAIERHLEARWLATKRREKRFDVGLVEGTR